MSYARRILFFLTVLTGAVLGLFPVAATHSALASPAFIAQIAPPLKTGAHLFSAHGQHRSAATKHRALRFVPVKRSSALLSRALIGPAHSKSHSLAAEFGIPAVEGVPPVAILFPQPARPLLPLLFLLPSVTETLAGPTGASAAGLPDVVSAPHFEHAIEITVSRP
jgi:hypothetical protein